MKGVFKFVVNQGANLLISIGSAIVVDGLYQGGRYIYELHQAKKAKRNFKEVPADYCYNDEEGIYT